MSRSHYETYFQGESHKLWSEKLVMRGGVTIVTSTSSNSSVASRLWLVDESGVS